MLSDDIAKSSESPTYTVTQSKYAVNVDIVNTSHNMDKIRIRLDADKT